MMAEIANGKADVFDNLHFTFLGLTPPNNHDFLESSLQELFRSGLFIHLFSYSILDNGSLDENLFFATKKDVPMASYRPFTLIEAQELVDIPLEQVRSNTFDTSKMTGVVFLGTRAKTNMPIIAICLPNNYFKENVELNRFSPMSYKLLPEISFEVSNGMSFVRHLLRSRFCQTCGTSCSIPPVGRFVICSTCKKNLYLKCDVATIGIVTSSDGSKCVLLKRRDFWTIVSGYSECGESPMDCMTRECREEIGIGLRKDNEHVTSLMTEGGFSYWPASGTYMFGFSCTAEEGEEGKEIIFDKHEVPDAKWYTKEAVFNAMMEEASGLTPQFKLAGRHSLARRIMERWVFGADGEKWKHYQELLKIGE